MIIDEFYNETMAQINEGAFGNLAKIGALIGGLALGEPALAAKEMSLPPRPRGMEEMYVGNLGMATNIAAHSNYISLSTFLTANEI